VAKKELTEKSEIKRLMAIYKDVPPNQYKVAEGLIIQAARLRVYLDALWKDLEKNGTTELFTQSEKTEPYERERPAARLFISTDKNYQAIIKQLNEMTPPSKKDSKLNAFLNE